MAAKFLRALLIFVFTALPLTASDLPKNTKLEVRLEETLSSDTSQTGQHFTATVNKSVSLGEAVVLEKGAVVEGVVKLAESTYNYRQAGELDLELISIRSHGKLYVVGSNTLMLMGRATATDPRTGRPMDPGLRKSDATRAAIDTATGGSRGTVGTIPGTDISVGTGSGQSGMQVIVTSKSKLTFNLSSASTDDTPK
jgi:hypothetical protein